MASIAIADLLQLRDRTRVLLRTALTNGDVGAADAAVVPHLVEKTVFALKPERADYVSACDKLCKTLPVRQGDFLETTFAKMLVEKKVSLKALLAKEEECRSSLCG